MEKLKQLKCPSCGATLNQSSPNQMIIECPYCHQQVVNDIRQVSEKDKEIQALEFKMTENEVVKQLIKLLIENQNVPTDIFDKMKIITIKRYYVPMYIFEGNFRAAWTATVERHEERQRIKQNGEIENYYETLYDYPSGEAVGNFSVNSTPLKEIADFNLDIKQLQKIKVNYASLTKFSSVKIIEDTIEIISPISNLDSLWCENGEKTVTDIGKNAAYGQAPIANRVDVSVSKELKKTSFLYIPLWIISYKYNDDLFNSIYYAEQFMDYNHPKSVNIKAQPTTEQEAVLERYNKRDKLLSKIRAFGCLTIILIGFIGCCSINLYESKHYDYHYGTEGGVDFLFQMFYVGIALLIIIPIVQGIFKAKEGIDVIEKDIENRTRALHNEADDYRKETGKAFLNKYFVSRHDLDNNLVSTSHAKPTALFDANPSKTKTCVRCSKQIDINHMFCKNCGAKQC